MPFRLFHKKPFTQTDPETWKTLWQSLVPSECRNVPVTVDGHTEIAFVCINQFVMMLQDGLLMEASFFDVCEHFQKAGYHVIWLMRCTKDIYNGYLKPGKNLNGGRQQWIWKKPTTNFGRWMSDNGDATILIQHKQVPPEGLKACNECILQRVIFAQSDDSSRMIPGHTAFFATDCPGTPTELLRWLNGTTLANLRADK